MAGQTRSIRGTTAADSETAVSVAAGSFGVMKLHLTSMTVGLAVGVTAAVTGACGLGAYLYSVHHFNALLADARAMALTQGQLIRAGLEHQMLENDRSLIERMIKSFGQEPQVERVMLLDREGRLRYSSAPLEPGTDLTLRSPTCQACHRYPPEQRTASRVIETRERTLLRTVIPVANRQACFRCHDATHRINGILIVDLDAGEIRATLNRDLRLMVGGSAGLALLLVLAIAGVVRVVVTRRLQRFETTARLIAAGDLQRRVPVSGADTIAWLGHEFNAMADTMTGLLKDVRAQREQLETVINSIDDGIVVLDVDRTVIAANDAFLRRTGRGREDVLGRCCSEVDGGACGSGPCPTEACLQTGERQVRICERRGPAGEVIWEEVHASPVRRSHGAIVQVVEVWRDISDRRAAEARLAESHRLVSLGLLASGFSHELNTPLATILACVEGIQRSARGRGEDDAADWRRIDENAATAREQLLRCRGITQHFLRLARGQGSPGDLVELAPTLAEVAQLIEPTARARSVAIRLEPVPELLRVRANDAELQHVLLNLLLNAVEACSPGGCVVVTARGGDAVHVSVSDDGCGISPELQQRIFEPFVSARPGGTGLGLFLSLEFVRHWGGDIRVRSTPGDGLDVRGRAARGRAAGGAAGDPVKPRPSVLLVDDDETFRRVLAAELARLGFEITGAASGEEAIRVAATLEPQVVLLDLQLPDLDGLRVLEAIRERSPGSEVIVLTGHGSFDTAIQSIRMGAFDYVAKPCPLDELEMRLDRALERRALQQRASLLERGLTPPDPGASFVGESPAFRKTLALVERVAASDSTVLVWGETGAGKEIAAKLIHARSPRRGRPFVIVDCATLQEDLLQSELFGHERGAFTGADRAKPGLFEVANGGTLFLDEIGEVSPATQQKLLRVLDSGSFRHVGGTSEIRVDVRVIAATNRNLGALVRQKLFREDLYYRLSTIAIEVPPLRERRGDVRLLAEQTLARLNRRYGFSRRLGGEALALLERYHWPGNVRELLHVVESAAVLCETDEIGEEQLPAALRSAGSAPIPAISLPVRPRGAPRPRRRPRACRRSKTSSGRTSSACSGRPAAIAAARPRSWVSASGTSTASSRSTASPEAAG